ncbi:hypothetical protein ALC56_00159, partial [Trachymyrmex septentrionalis]
LVRQHLERLNLLKIDFSRVYNCNESAFLLSPKEEYVLVLVKKGSKSVHKIVNNDKEYLTVLLMVKAGGMLVSPMVIKFLCRTLYKRYHIGFLVNFHKIGQLILSEKEWITESFFEFINNNFYQWLVTNNIKFPIVLYVDGHSSHLTLIKFCRSVQIELIALYPNAIHILHFWIINCNFYIIYNNKINLTFESMCPLTIKLPIMSMIVPPMNRRTANIMAFHGIFIGGLTN